jgi:hypothetical protein
MDWDDDTLLCPIQPLESSGQVFVESVPRNISLNVRQLMDQRQEQTPFLASNEILGPSRISFKHWSSS